MWRVLIRKSGRYDYQTIPMFPVFLLHPLSLIADYSLVASPLRIGDMMSMAFSSIFSMCLRKFGRFGQRIST